MITFRWSMALATASCLSLAIPTIASAQQPQQRQQPQQPQVQQQRPNILVIWGDDIGTWNISHAGPTREALHVSISNVRFGKRLPNGVM